MKAKTQLYLTFMFVFIIAIFYSCKSSFPAAGTAVECNGQLLRPILNPTKRPQFPGGPQAMSQFLKDNVKLSQETKVNGTVRVAFIVTKNGSICDVRITSKPKKYIDNEVTRVVKMMPNWIPGYNAGEFIDSYYLLGINF